MIKTFKLFTFLFFIINLLPAQYNTYSYEEIPANLSFQRVIETKDGGFFMAALGDCYIPGQVAVEGCIFAMHFVRTDAMGDTLWTSSTPYNIQLQPKLSLYENKDGSFTVITTRHTSYICDGRVVAPSLRGFNQIEIINLDNTGQVVDDILFPNECALTLQDVVSLNNSRYATLAYFNKPFSTDPELEGRLFIMTKQGEILQQISFPGEEFKGGNLIYKNSNELLLTYLGEGDTLILKRFDLELNLLSEVRKSMPSNFCFRQEFPDVEVKLLNNGELGLICYEHLPAYSNVTFSRLDTALNVLSEQTHQLANPSNFQENSDGQLLIASTTQSNGVTHTAINYFSSTGDSLNSEILPHPGDQTPEHILLTSDNRLAIAGSENCCNYPSDIGPSKSFLLLKGESTTSIEEEDHSLILIYPNPVDSDIMIRIEDFRHRGYELDIYSALGQKVLYRSIDRDFTEVSMRSLSRGIYFYTLSLEGRLVKKGKLMKR